ncbi:MAG TPA: DUF6265 family protein [Allosphingosinicella sp.]
MKRLVLLAASASLLCSAAAPAPEPSLRVESLGWMAGSWVSEHGSKWTEERWSAPRGGVMVGTSLSGEGGKATFFEYMRIAADAEGVPNFWASPAGKTAVPFRLVSHSRREAAFENPKNDFPTRIVYRRTGNSMTGTISGPGGSNPMSWRFRRRSD